MRQYQRSLQHGVALLEGDLYLFICSLAHILKTSSVPLTFAAPQLSTPAINDACIRSLKRAQGGNFGRSHPQASCENV